MFDFKLNLNLLIFFSYSLSLILQKYSDICSYSLQTAETFKK